MLNDSHKSRIVFMQLILAAVVILSECLSIFINVHIDAENVVAIGYRAAVGDAFFTEIQEPQLLLGPILGILAKIYIKIANGTAGIYLFFKAVTALITLLVSLFGYKVLARKAEKTSATIAACIFALFHFRYVNTLDYTFFFDVSSFMCILLWLNIENARNRRISIFMMSVSFCIMVLCFPIALVLYPFYCYMAAGKLRKKEILLMTVFCMAIGCLELFALFHGHKIDNIPNEISALVGNSTYGKKKIEIFKIAELIVILLLLVLNNNRGILSNFVSILQTKSRISIFLVLSAYGFIIYGLGDVINETVVKLQYYSKTGYLYALTGGGNSLIYRGKKLA